MKEKLLKILQICFVAGLAVIVFAGLGRALFAPKTVNVYENRLANLLPEFSVSGIFSNEYQDGVESALNDQVHCAEFLKTQYNKTESGVAYKVLTSIFKRDPNKAYNYNGLLVRGGDALLYYPKTLNDAAKASLTQRAAEISAAVEANPGQEFYVYYIEKDTDINFNNGNKTGHSDYLGQLLSAEGIKYGINPVADFEDYYRRFYKSDHHWNHIGAYECYLDLLDFLGIESEPVENQGEFLIGKDMSGSKAAYTRSAGVWVEDMYGYYLNFPWMGTHINGWWTENYGVQNFPDPELLSYGGYYGDDYGQIVLNTGREELDNILVIGDSYDNAILKLIASHYDVTHSIDLRYYEHYMGEEFVLSDYIAENGIDKVLIIGSINFFLSEDFALR